MKRLFVIILFIISLPPVTLGQDTARNRRNESDKVLKSINTLIQPVRKNLFTTQVGIFAGGGRVRNTDKEALSFAGNLKAIYYMTGALYSSIGIGYTQVNSYDKQAHELGIKDTLHTSSIAMLPLGLGFTIGDDRAQIITGIDFLPALYLDTNPSAPLSREFALGFAPEFGFTIRIGRRYHLGMQGTIQFIQPYDKTERTDYPRYTFVGVGAIFQYD